MSVCLSIRDGARVRHRRTTGPGPTKRDPAHVQQRGYAAKIPFLPGPGSGLPECVACVCACACRGLETQVLRSEYRGPETRGPETQCPFIEVLDSGTEAATHAYIALRYVKTRRQQQKNRVAKNSRQHFNGIMSSSAATRRRSRFCRAWARDSQSALRAPVEVLKPRS